MNKIFIVVTAVSIFIGGFVGSFLFIHELDESIKINCERAILGVCCPLNASCLHTYYDELKDECVYTTSFYETREPACIYRGDCK